MSAMDQDEDEFLYGDASTAPPAQPLNIAPTLPGLSVIAQPPTLESPSAAPQGQGDADSLEEGEEGEEEEEEIEVTDDSDDSDIELITERKDGSRPEPPPRPERYNQIRTASVRPPQSAGNKSTAPNNQSAASPAPPTVAQPVLPPNATSKLDVGGAPSYNGTAITKIPMESELLPSEKPWRKPGADVTDYFNYGFDEFTWTAYCQKQEGLREEFSPQKMMEQMMMMSGMGMGMPMPGMDPSAMAGDMSAMMAGAFGMSGQQQGGGAGGGAPQGPGMAGQQGPQGMDIMGDPNMYMQQGFDGRGGPQDGGFGMGRGGVPPQGPAAGPMGGYGAYDQGIQMQGARGPAPFGPRGRGSQNRRW